MDSVGEGEGGKIWENGIETCKISCMKRVASPVSMHDTITGRGKKVVVEAGAKDAHVSRELSRCVKIQHKQERQARKRTSARLKTVFYNHISKATFHLFTGVY